MDVKVTIEKGKVVIPNQLLFDEYIEKFEGKDMLLSIRPVRKQRSLNQNAYYHGVVLKILGEELGYFKDEMHDALKNKFLKYRDEHGLERTKSTSDLTTLQMREYIEQIRSWAMIDFAIDIPEPDEQIAWSMNEEDK